jgi:hypothetical protein
VNRGANRRYIMGWGERKIGAHGGGGGQ